MDESGVGLFPLDEASKTNVGLKFDLLKCVRLKPDLLKCVRLKPDLLEDQLCDEPGRG